MGQPTGRKSQVSSFLASLVLVVLVSLAIGGSHYGLVATLIGTAIAPALILRAMFPDSRLLWIVFINLAAVYAAVFALFTDQIFASVGAGVQSLGFALPIMGFLTGCWRRRSGIADLIRRPDVRGERGLLAELVWLLPVAAVGLAIVALSRLSLPLVDTSLGFLIAMTAIALIVLMVSGSVAIFLIDTGLLFEEFSSRVSHLLVPAFAFLTVYALIAVAFGALYSVVSRYDPQPHFRIGGELRQLSFAESLHFSIVTLSTVGYGDIVPASSLARILAASEVVLGVLLLLFGVSEILEYARERRRSGRREKPD